MLYGFMWTKVVWILALIFSFARNIKLIVTAELTGKKNDIKPRNKPMKSIK